MKNELILEMRNIVKRFPGVLALDQVNLNVYSGEIHALCGENGAGKSTLMKILSGSYNASSYEGEILMDGKTVWFQNPHDSEASGIGMIYQEISMHLDMSITENIFLGRWMKSGTKIDWKRMNQEAQKYLDMVGLHVPSDTILRQLGASQQQLVSIARALSKTPRILVMDEPTSPLTQKEADKLFEIMHQLKEKGIACILITHKMDEVFTHADRVTVIRDGKTISTQRLQEATSHDIIRDMVGREITNFYPKEQVLIGEPVMEVRNFSVRHPSIPGRKIIDDVSFELRKGEILGLAGLVGVGRSELVNAIFGSDVKLSGQVLINGQAVEIRKPKDAMAHGMALVTEDRKANGIIGGMSIAENISLPNLQAVSKKGILNPSLEEVYGKKYYKELKIKANSLSTLLRQLSGGNQQKVIIAKWMAREPKILILDEPTRGIDVSAKYEIYKIMVEMAKNGVGIIVISSELPELLSMADRILVIANKKIAGELDRNEFSQERIMELSALN